MRLALNRLPSRPYRLAVTAGAFGLVLSACSQDSSRFQDDPFSNPFRSRSDTTSSVPNAPAGQVESQPLSGPSNYSSAPRSVPAAPAPTYTPRQASYDPGVTGSSSPQLNDSGWTADGGTAVTLQQGETIDTIARRYGVPASAIMRANNFADASYVRPGARVVIPTYQGSPQRAASVQPVPAAPMTQPRQQTYQPAPPPARAAAPAPARSSRVHVVNAGDTLYSLGRRYGMSHSDIARANGINDNASLNVGQRMNIPGQGAVASTPSAAPGPAPAQFSPAPPVHRQASIEPAAAPEPAQKVAAVTPVPQVEEQRSLGGSPQFRWPVRGRVISAYGAKSNGQHNDGINLAVPEGTEVKAAEDGVVAYAGNELKGYGNLVLLRHADGWMTAYAHNSQLLVKRGETIKRGQNVARAGQTGGVSSPQVHFEIRKGSTPVDPTQYLAGG
jgi:murein DD-endopeptidase MepM/ murein hydrolase activator NlpD